MDVKSNMLTTDLRSMATALRKETDRCTAELRAIETELSDLDLGIEVEGPCIATRPLVSCHAHEAAVPREQWSLLCYGELDGVGRLLVRDYIALHPGDVREQLLLEDEFPLLDGPASLRATAADHVELLLARIHEHVGSQLASLKAAKAPTKRTTNNRRRA